jgi:hypothetical protein
MSRRTRAVEKILAGSARSNTIRDDDAFRRDAPPEPPPGEVLTPEELRLWAWVLPDLPPSARADGMSVLTFVRTTLRKNTLERLAMSVPLVEGTGNGAVVHPVSAALNAISREWRQQAGELGIGPSARLRFSPATTAAAMRAAMNGQDSWDSIAVEFGPLTN